MRVLDHLLKDIRSAAVYNPEIQVPPACILWPDHDRQWETAISRLQSEMPELLVLGDYEPEKEIGPAIWLRCIIAGINDPHITQANADLSSIVAKIRSSMRSTNTIIPVLYLPGVSRRDLRAVETCPDYLKALAELQFRGVIWSQINSKDWTILAYLKSNQGGLGLDVAQDNDTKKAMQLSLYRLLDEDVSLLQAKHLDKDYFNTLLSGNDLIRDLLQWLDQGEVFQRNRDKNEWEAFVEVCESQLAYHPQKEGILTGITKLANHQGPWHAVWERYCEASKRYANIPNKIRKCTPPQWDLYTDSDSACGWPQWNDDQEKSLQYDLLALAQTTAHEARKKLLKLEEKHGGRRSLVWAELGEAPLAFALQYLAILAEITQNSLAAGSLDDLISGYRSHGWQADDAVLKALAQVESSKDIEAVIAAIRAIYLPWIEESARYLQNLVDSTSYPGGTCLTPKKVSFSPGDCILFVDGLRFDMGKRLISTLEARNYKVTEELAWSALPSVTETGKAAVSPVRDRIFGEDSSTDFEPSVIETGQSLKGGYNLKKLLRDSGWAILENSNAGDSQGMAWCEFGDIDHEGHARGWKLTKYIDSLILEITDRITELLAAGWKRVRVVTDHGWLLLPGGLPKINLPSALVDSKWGRCAALKPGATSDVRLFPWYWNPNQYFALADGVSCFKRGEEYTHGGLSLQECLTLHLLVTQEASEQTATSVKIAGVVWKGLRCTVTVEGYFSGLAIDIRSHAGDASSSVVVDKKTLKDNGTTSVIVEDEDMEGQAAIVVLIDENGSLIAQTPTVIAGGNP